jgi:hypothetical protein
VVLFRGVAGAYNAPTVGIQSQGGPVSSKKQLRRARQAQEQEEKQRSKVNPVWMFLASIAAVVVVVGVAMFFFGPERGAPPWPGAVWSAQHGHWH